MPNLCSIICVTYNHAAFSAQGLQSIFDQSYRDIEIIVLDDGSTDGNPEIIQQKLADSPFPVIFEAQENSGNVPANFNKALSMASGEYLAFLSLDDMLLPESVSLGMTELLSDRNCIFAANSGYQEINDKNEVTEPNGQMPVTNHAIVTAQDLMEAEYTEIGTFYIQGQVFRRDAVAAIGGFDPDKIGDDIILRTKLFKLLLNNPELRFSLGEEKVFAYRKHENNLHKQSFRQIRTVIEWKEEFFPDRPYPDRFYRWLEYFFRDCVRNDLKKDLDAALLFRPLVPEHYVTYKKSAKMRLEIIRTKIKKALGLN